MFQLGKKEAAQSWAAELGAILAAQRATLEFERRFAPAEDKDQLGRGIFEARIVEMALAKSPESRESLSRATDHAVTSLQALSMALYPLLGLEVDLGPRDVLRLVCAMYWLGRLSDERTRAYLTAARDGRQLAGFDDAVDTAAETEQLLFALRRFEGLLERGGEWIQADKIWLRLWAASTPGRLRLRAAVLRSLESQALERPLPGSLATEIAAFKSGELSESTALAWHAAGFIPEEALDWRDAGLIQPSQAHAWHCHGFGPAEASEWARAGLLPDESGIFVYGGAADLETASALHKALGDVERLLPWYRAGHRAPAVLGYLQEGIRTPDQAAAISLGMVPLPAALTGPVQAKPFGPEVQAMLAARPVEQEPAAEAEPLLEGGKSAGQSAEATAAGAPAGAVPTVDQAGNAPWGQVWDEAWKNPPALPKQDPRADDTLREALAAEPVPAAFEQIFGIKVPPAVPAGMQAGDGAGSAAAVGTGDAGPAGSESTAADSPPSTGLQESADGSIEGSSPDDGRGAGASAATPAAKASKAAKPAGLPWTARVPIFGMARPHKLTPEEGATLGLAAPVAPAAGEASPQAGADPARPGSATQAAAAAEPAAPAESWACKRAREVFGVEAPEESQAWSVAPAGGGAWIGWGVFEASESVGGGAPPVLRLPLGEGAMDLATASEGVALPGKAYRPETFIPDTEWQSGLDAVRSARGAAETAGSWHLYAWQPARAVLAWGLVYPAGPPPWSDAVDYEVRENWTQRWKRKTEEWGEEGAEPQCRVGRTLDQGWFVALKEGLQVQGSAAPTPIDTHWNRGSWREQFQDFCLKMEIPVRAAHWNLLAGSSEDAP